MKTCLKVTQRLKNLTQTVKFKDDEQKQNFKDLKQQVLFKKDFKNNDDSLKESPSKFNLRQSFDDSYRKQKQLLDQDIKTEKPHIYDQQKRSSVKFIKFEHQYQNFKIIFENFNSLILSVCISIWDTFADLKANIFTKQFKFSEEQANFISQHCEIYQNCTPFLNKQILYQKQLIECPQLQIKLFQEGLGLLEQSYLPQLKNSTIELFPSLQELYLMSENELKEVANFKIRNQFGEIEFLEPVDVTYQNFDHILKMTNYEITLYPKNIFMGNTYQKPKRRTKLNKKCLIKFNQSDIKEKCCDNQKLIVNQLIRECQQKHLTFQFFDNQKGWFTAMADGF